MIPCTRMYYERPFNPANVATMMERGLDNCRKILKRREQATGRMICRGAPRYTIKWAQTREDEAREAVNRLQKGG